MKITFLERQFNEKEISIERLFNYIKKELDTRGISYDAIKNPYDFGFFQILKGIIFFYKKKGLINHVTGHINWACLLLSSRNTILTIHDLGENHKSKSLKKIAYYYLFVYFPIRKMKYITVISEKTKSDIVALIPEAKHKIRVIPNCLTIAEDSTDYKKKSVIPEFLIVGTRSNKNIENSIKALKDVNCHLTIIGEMNENQNDLLVKNNVDFTNKKFISEEELLEVYKKADILLFMSLFEGFGLPILEAQAQNCLVITSNISPMNEIGGAGIVLANPILYTDIREKIMEVLNYDENIRKNKIKLGKENIKNYSIESITEKYIQIYREIDINQNKKF